MAMRKRNWKHGAVNPLVFAPRFKLANSDGDEVLLAEGGETEMDATTSPVPAEAREKMGMVDGLNRSAAGAKATWMAAAGAMVLFAACVGVLTAICVMLGRAH